LFDFKVQCTSQTCADAPPACYQYNAVYKIFHYLTDIEFRLSITDGKSPFLKYSHLILMDRYSNEVNGEFFFLHVDGKELRYEQVVVDGVNIDYKLQLFEKYMKEVLQLNVFI